MKIAMHLKDTYHCMSVRCSGYLIHAGKQAGDLEEPIDEELEVLELYSVHTVLAAIHNCCNS